MAILASLPIESTSGDAFFTLLRNRLSSSPQLQTTSRMRLSLVSLVSKAVMVGAQLVATYLVLVYLNPKEQGYYYSFIALIAVQGIFELGLSQVLVVFMAHESTVVAPADLQGYRPNRRLRAIASASLLQYVKLTMLFAVSVGLMGTVFFQLTRGFAPQDGRVEWAIPWALLVVSSSLRLPIIWLEAVIEGIGQIRQVLTARIVAQFAWAGAFFLTLHAGLGLLAPTIAALALIVISLTVYWPYRHIVRRLTHHPAQQAQRVNWKRELQPMQRRVSGTWIASYLISNTPVPLCFALLGAVEAGRAGVAFQVAASIGVIAGALVGPKISVASRLVAARLVEEYRALMLRTMRQTLAAGAAVALLAIAVLVAIPITDPLLGHRLPSALVTAPLLIAAMINCLMSCVAVFSRAQKNELFTVPLLLVAFITILGSVAAQGAGGLLTISGLHALGALCITLPFSVFAFRRTVALPTSAATVS